MEHTGRKVIVAGGRDFNDYFKLAGTLDRFLKVDDTLISGAAKGADSLAFDYALEEGYSIDEYHADWDKHGKLAGAIRNKQMAEIGDVLVAFWDGKSKGTKNMIDTALSHNLEVHVYRY